MQIKMLSLLLLGACATNPISAGGDGDDGPVGVDTSYTDDSGLTNRDWRSVPLTDDGELHRSQTDRVTAMLFSTPYSGYIATASPNGGAVFRVNQVYGDGPFVSLAFGAAEDRPAMDYTRLVQTPSGVVATAYAADIVRADADGNFALIKNGNLEGGERVIGYRELDSGTTMLRDTGIVSTAAQASGPSAEFTDVWAPSDRIPEHIPAEQCHVGPSGATYIGNDWISYTAVEAWHPEICISTDGGHAFYASVLDVPSNTVGSAPAGVVFGSQGVGLTWLGAENGHSYIQRTVDGGTTWSDVVLPPLLHRYITGRSISLNAGFFAPDGQSVWIVGHDHDANRALVLHSSDAGIHWSRIAGLGRAELFAGFAVDAEHVWLGGANGTVLASN